MHVGMALVFQNPDDTRDDREVYDAELGLGLRAERLGFEDRVGVRLRWVEHLRERVAGVEVGEGSQRPECFEVVPGLEPGGEECPQRLLKSIQAIGEVEVPRPERIEHDKPDFAFLAAGRRRVRRERQDRRSLTGQGLPC